MLAATRPSAKWRSTARAARASAAWISVLPGAVGDPDEAPLQRPFGMRQRRQPPQGFELLARGVDPPLRRGRAKIGEPLAAMLDLAAEQRRRQPRARFGKRGAALRRARAKRARQAVANLVEPLAERAEQSSPPPASATAPKRSPARASPRTDALASRWPMIAEQRRQLGAHRHRDLGRGGRGRRAAVGGEVDQRGVGLMADRARSAGSARRRRRAPPPLR